MSAPPAADHQDPPATVTEAVILMAGIGSRLSGSDVPLAKPLVQIAGQPLIVYILEALSSVGIRTVHAVTGAQGESLSAEIARLLPAGMRLRTIVNPAWDKQNGISVLAAAGRVQAPFFLLMGDHLFDPAILPMLLRDASGSSLKLAIDKKVEAVFDLEDAMKVQTRGELVETLGKDLAHYDAIDTGIFLCPATLFDYLEQARREGDCSLADGVRLMAADGKVLGIDIGAAWWQDVDTPGMREHAETMLQAMKRSRTGDAFTR